MAASPSSSWSDLLPDLLGLVLVRLPLPCDRARFRAVCRAWRTAARHHVRQLPWMVFPDGSFGTIGHGGGFYFPAGIPGLPENVTCLGAAAVGWLALDCTDDVLRRSHCSLDLDPRHDIKHKHSYRLYNPFTGNTVLLPELDSAIGEVAETFEIRKVLMHPSSDSADSGLVVVATNSRNCNVILCRPGKGSCVVPNIDVFDVAYHGDRLYGITPEEELVALDLAEDDDGTPIVTKCRRVIKRLLADGEEDHRSWMYDDSSSDDNDGDSSDGELEEEEEDHEEEDDDDDDEEEEENSSQNGEEDSFNGDAFGEVNDGIDIRYNKVDKHILHDIFWTYRRLVQSFCGDGDNEELLMVRHHTQSSPQSGTYTLGVDILKADMEAGSWVPISELAKGEALFLSRSFSKSIHAYGDIKEGFLYYTNMEDVFDIKSGDCSCLRLPKESVRVDPELLTWLFPPQLQL